MKYQINFLIYNISFNIIQKKKQNFNFVLNIQNIEFVKK